MLAFAERGIDVHPLSRDLLTRRHDREVPIPLIFHPRDLTSLRLPTLKFVHGVVDTEDIAGHEIPQADRQQTLEEH